MRDTRAVASVRAQVVDAALTRIFENLVAHQFFRGAFFGLSGILPFFFGDTLECNWLE